MAKVINKSNISKTIRYLKKNGLINTYYAAKERVELKKAEPYIYVAPTEDELERQRAWSGLFLGEGSGGNDCIEDPGRFTYMPTVSLVMPAYETPERFLREAIDAVISQTYPNWELIIADASESESVNRVVSEYTNCDYKLGLGRESEKKHDCGFESERGTIRYFRLTENKGISDNTNAAIVQAKGDYIALLDHDDLITPDALFEMVDALNKYMDASDVDQILPAILYSDEDKIDADSTTYFDPHKKYEFNYDLLLTNNYICHLMMVRSDILHKIRLRGEYDGAQDYDLVLQIVRYLVKEEGVKIPALGKHIIHVPKVLYHWRSHANSTAENTASKMYAYEAGLHALKEHVESLYGRNNNDSSSNANVSHSKHLGFYNIKWGDKPTDIFNFRPEVGAIIGRVLDKRGNMTRVIKDQNGMWLYEGINKHYAGELNHFDCEQNVYYADEKYMVRRPGLEDYDSTKLAREGYMIVYLPVKL